MKVNDDLIEKIAKLAKLKFDSKSAKNMKRDLKKIIDFVDKLSEIDTKEIEPLIYLSNEVNVLREDEIENISSQKDALSNAPDKDSDYFKVPVVLKK